MDNMSIDDMIGNFSFVEKLISASSNDNKTEDLNYIKKLLYKKIQKRRMDKFISEDFDKLITMYRDTNVVTEDPETYNRHFNNE